MNIHESVRNIKAGAENFEENYAYYKNKYDLPPMQ